MDLKRLKISVFLVLCLVGWGATNNIYGDSSRVALLISGQSNCYLFGQSGEAVIIDASANPNQIIAAVTKEKLKIKYIILTHAHHDHISYADVLRTKLSAKVILHQNDLALLRESSPDTYIDAVVKGGEIINIGGTNLRILHTPGHSPGSISIVADNMVFTGDTLFKNSIGRTDFSGGSQEAMITSLKLLMELDNNLMVCPGHGETSSIGCERANNPWINSNFME